MAKYTIKKIDQKFILKNKKKVFDTWSKIWKGSFWEKLSDRNIEDDTKYFLWLIDNGIGYIVYEKENIVGFMFGTFDSFQEPKNIEERKLFKEVKNSYQHISILHELVISHKHRKQGLGSQLILKFLEESYNRKCEVAILYTEASSTSQHLYQRLDFKKIRNIPVKREGIKDIENRLYFIKKLK